MKKIFLATLFLSIAISTFAQEEGNPIEKALNTTVCSFDSEASAFITSSDMDICVRSRGQDDFLCVTRSKQIKILKESGIDAANVEFFLYDEESVNGRHDELIDLTACSYNIEDGKVVKTKLTKETISKQRVDSRTMCIRFAIPNVKVGSVISYEYKTFSEAMYDLPTWYAQDYYPVEHAHCSIQLPGYISYYYEQTGYHQMHLDKKEVENHSLHTTDMLFKFTCDQLPALPKNTDYTYCPSDYADKILFEVSEVQYRGIRRSFTKKQEDVNRLLFDSNEFGGRLKQKNPLKEEMAAQGIAAIPDVTERVKATIMLLRSKLRWNGKYNLIGTSLAKVLKEGSGNNADLNFVLMSMLKDAGVTCHPVVMSRRSRGILPVNRPSIDAINTFVVAIEENPTTIHYYDCSAENGYLDILPAELNVDRAFLLYSARKYDEVNLQKIVSQRSNVNISLEIDSNGTIHGIRRNSYSGLAALDIRNQWFERNDSTAFVDDIATANNIEIGSFHTKGFADFSPAAIYDYDFTSQLDESTQYYIKPFGMPVFNENPFTEPETVLPKEFPATSSYAIATDIKLPEGYHLAEEFSPVSLNALGNLLNCKIIVKEVNSHIQASCRVNINTVHIDIPDYPVLREFFDLLEKACNEMIVIERKQ